MGRSTCVPIVFDNRRLKLRSMDFTPREDDLALRKIRCFDGLHYSFSLLQLLQSGLWETCCKIPADNSQAVPALAACWGFVDTLHRIREIVLGLPGLSQKDPEMRAFLRATEIVEEYRNYVQHFRRELHTPASKSFPVWGSLSWVHADNPQATSLVLFGARIPGMEHTSIPYDTEERRWVSRVCLGVAGKSFNFDPIFEAAKRFECFILQYLRAQISPYAEFREELQIISITVPPTN